ncbi:MAG: zinc-dependent metalloprotease [Bacteroidetes bacterium]|nr:zinc-dependent metalloprotease [Bacteroidota bacterium]
MKQITQKITHAKSVWKKLIFSAVLFVLSASLSTGELKAQSSAQENCENATDITLTNAEQTIIQPNASGWIYFVSTDRNPDIRLQNNIGSIVFAQAYIGRCDSLIEIARDTISSANDTLLVLVLHDVMLGDTIKLFTQRNPSNNDTVQFQLNMIETQSLFTYLADVTPEDLTADQDTMYQKLLNHNMYSSINFVSIGNIVEKTPYGKMLINLPFLYCNNTKFVMSQVEYNDENNFTWIGNSFVYDDTLCSYGTITLLKDNGFLIGNMNLEDKSYAIFDLTGGVQVVCETDRSLYSESSCASHDDQDTTEIIVGAKDPCRDGKSKVLVLYTTNAQKALANNTAAVQAVANSAITQLNQNWANSKIDNKLSIVATLPLSFTEGSDINNDMITLKSSQAVQTLRNQYQAEIVVLLTRKDYYYWQGIYNSKKYFGLAGKVGVTSSGDAFVISDIFTAFSGAYYTFTHEINHLFGARHDDNCAGTTCAHLFKTGATLGLGGKKRSTVTSNIYTDRTLIEHTSNPNVKFMNVPTGTSSHNNAAKVNSMQYQLGEIYADPVPPTFDFMAFKGCSLPYWQAGVAICNGSLFTYKWFVSQNGYSWTQVGTGQTVNFIAPYKSGLIKCEVRNSANTLIFSKQKHYSHFLGCMGFVNRTDETTGIEKNIKSNNSLVCIPNPNNGSFDIELNSAETENEVNIVITDITGKVVKEVYKGVIPVGKKHITVNGQQKLAAGVYFLKVSGKTLNLVSKVIIE